MSIESASVLAGKQGLLEVPCNLCGEPHGKVLACLPSYLPEAPHLSLVCCPRCGLVYVSPRPGEARIAELYEDWWADGEKNKEEAPLLKEVHAHALSIIHVQRTSGTLLDVGCGAGAFLDFMARHGYDCEGVDYSLKGVEYIRNTLGLSARPGSLLEARYDADFFDALTAFYVLEHVTDPTANLAEMHRILKPGGILVLRVPNFAFGRLLLLASHVGIDARPASTMFCIPHHLYFYTSETLRSLCEKVGFSRVRVEPGPQTRLGGLVTRTARRAIYGIDRMRQWVVTRSSPITPAFTVWAIKDAGQEGRQ